MPPLASSSLASPPPLPTHLHRHYCEPSPRVTTVTVDSSYSISTDYYMLMLISSTGILRLINIREAVWQPCTGNLPREHWNMLRSFLPLHQVITNAASFGDNASTLLCHETLVLVALGVHVHPQLGQRIEVLHSDI